MNNSTWKRVPMILALLLGCDGVAAKWYGDAFFNFRIDVPFSWTSHQSMDGSDRVYTFLSPDENVAVRIRAFKVDWGTDLDAIRRAFEQHVLGGGELVSIEPYELNGLEGKLGAYAGQFDEVDVGAAVFFATHDDNAYIIWSMIPLELLDNRSDEADAILNTFQPYGDG